jgi:hypothetical protein
MTSSPLLAGRAAGRRDRPSGASTPRGSRTRRAARARGGPGRELDDQAGARCQRFGGGDSGWAAARAFLMLIAVSCACAARLAGRRDPRRDSRLSSPRADVRPGYARRPPFGGRSTRGAPRRQPSHPNQVAPGQNSLVRLARPGLHSHPELGFGSLIWEMSALARE